VNAVTSKGDTVSTVDKVSKDDTVTSKGDTSKTTSSVSNSKSATSKPNTELPDAGDNTLVARLSALPVIGLGFGLLLRRRNREE
jgi:LPXTG-motif cell wall anchor domain protein